MSFLMKVVVFNMNDLELKVAEETNVANILISNLVHQTSETARAPNEEAYKEHSAGFEIASKQVGSFISNLIMEKGNMAAALKRNHINLEPVNNVGYDNEDGRNS